MRGGAVLTGETWKSLVTPFIWTSIWLIITIVVQSLFCIVHTYLSIQLVNNVIFQLLAKEDLSKKLKHWVK